MTELLNDPALTPSLIGFLVGVVFTSIFAAIRGKLSRSVALAKEKVAEEKLAAFQSKTSALENEISTLRSSETRFLKHQGELEALTKANNERREEMKNFLDLTQATLTDELKRQEMVLKEAINKSQIAQGSTRRSDRIWRACRSRDEASTSNWPPRRPRLRSPAEPGWRRPGRESIRRICTRPQYRKSRVSRQLTSCRY
jgi:gas vesicle protein